MLYDKFLTYIRENGLTDDQIDILFSVINSEENINSVPLELFLLYVEESMRGN